MNNESEWELVFSDFKRDDNLPLQIVQLPREFYRHTIRIEVIADSIPKTWKTAGWLYHRLSPPSDTNRVIYDSRIVLVNCQQVMELNPVTDRFYLEYLPHRWFLWQDIKIWYWTKAR
ncbi:MAG: hypothetical protein SWJ54_12955 [Cyanobacteriota bacterium]|nr:hypothetical protein [Cyanobacteriota bacterium]